MIQQSNFCSSDRENAEGRASERRNEYESEGTSERARSEEAMEVPSSACPPTHRVRGKEEEGDIHI